MVDKLTANALMMFKYRFPVEAKCSKSVGPGFDAAKNVGTAWTLQPASSTLT
jgi:hypothetical protein